MSHDERSAFDRAPRNSASFRLGVRGRLFLVSCVLLGVFGATGAVYLAATLRPALEAQVEAELWRHTRSIAAALKPSDTTSLTAADAFADRFAESVDARVSIIGPTGRVLGDSRLDGPALAGVENHIDRPEVQAALAGNPTAARRHSATVKEDLIYVAVTAPQQVIVRVSRPLAQVEQAMTPIRSLLWVASLLGLLVALFMSFLASELFSRPLRRLLDRTRALAEGAASGPVDIDSTDELGGLAGEINRLGNSLHEVVAKLAEERDLLQAVLAGTDEVVLALDAKRDITLLNPAARKMFGDAEGQPLSECAEPPLAERLTRHLGESATTFEIELPDRWLLIRATPQARIEGWIVVMLDITRLRRLEKMRQDFVANVSHELRTPISVIQANAETLLDGAIDDPVAGRRFLEALVRNAARLSNLIADLLDIARIEAGKVAITLEPVSPSAVTALAHEAIEGLAHERSVELSVEVPEGLLVVADGKALEQVLLNLVENAVKYTPSGGSVQVRVVESDDSIRLEVRDDGPGIPAEHRDRVFERFYRVDAGRSSDMGGTGLGLAIVKHLVLSMNGELGVADNEPQGAVFWVRLPRVTPA